jgi:acyl-CoA thioester hydrolase
MIHSHRFRVRYAETDAMRVAHHAAYLVWLEAARVEALRALGFSFAEVEASGYGHAVRDLRIQYRRPARFDQELVLRVAIAEARGPRMTFGYRLYDAKEWDEFGATPELAAGEAGGSVGRAEPTPLAVAMTEMIWVTPEGYPTRLPPSHPVSPVLDAQPRYPDWAAW